MMRPFLMKLARSFLIPLLTLQPSAALKELARLGHSNPRFCQAAFF